MQMKAALFFNVHTYIWVHVYGVCVWESAHQGQGAQLLVRHPFLNSPPGTDQVLKSSGFTQLQIITLVTGARFTWDSSA